MFDSVERTEDLDGAAATEATPLHPADASDELIAILCRIDRLEAQAAAALAKMNDAAKWRRKGYTSATAFLKHRAGFAAGRAMGLVARSNALGKMPYTAAAFARGDLSVDQVDVLVGAYNFNEEAFAADEAMLVDLTVQLPFVRELWHSSTIGNNASTPDSSRSARTCSTACAAYASAATTASGASLEP